MVLFCKKWISYAVTMMCRKSQKESFIFKISYVYMSCALTQVNFKINRNNVNVSNID